MRGHDDKGSGNVREQSSAADNRHPACVERWPDCEDGAYHPDCCRFPKSCSCTIRHDAAPSDAATSTDVTVQSALNRVGRRLNVHDVAALEELDAAFRAWAEGKAGTIWWESESRLAVAIAAVIHVDLVEADPDDA